MADAPILRERIYRPEEGWLPLIFVSTAVLCAAGSVASVAWISQDDLVIWTAVFGLAMGGGLAKRPIRPLPAWFLILIYALLLPILRIGNLFPPLAIFANGWQATRTYWLGNGAWLWDRSSSWVTAVSAGQSSQETAVFAMVLGTLTWLLAAYVGWSSYRQKRPLLGLTLMGTAVACNSYFGQEGFEWVAAFIAAAGITTAVMQYAHLEQGWVKNRVDYSNEIRTELAFYAGAIAVGLLLIAIVIPGIRWRLLTNYFAQLDAVQAAEATLERAFAGVNQPDRNFEAIPGLEGRVGIMPRSYLLGDAPELYETVMMTAVTDIPLPDQATHWRGLSYDLYTGRGWALSEERFEEHPTDTPIVLNEFAGQTAVHQQINWQFGQRVLRYTLGTPHQFNQNSLTFWRGNEDYVRTQSNEGLIYEAISLVSSATDQELREATGNIPPALLARYTQLPQSVPERVHELAQEVTANSLAPYDKALTLERFLRQYEYSLDIDAPPSDLDPVDYFLFEQQAGYCDYYASAMVVMARSLGLPARIGIGYLAQTPDENGVQTIRQINGHSWAEIYFPEYGWIEFEPTAAFSPPPRTVTVNPNEGVIRDDFAPDPTDIVPPPLPDPEPAVWWWQWLIIPLIVFIVGLIWWWRTRPIVDVPAVVWAYGRLQNQARQLGQPTPASQTPTEFEQTFSTRLADYGRSPRMRHWVKLLRRPITHITASFIAHQYQQKGVELEEDVEALWQLSKRPFRRLRLWHWLQQKRPFKSKDQQ